MFAGGISTVSFSATGQFCLTAGLDGTVMLHSVSDADRAHISPLPKQAKVNDDMQDFDAVDEATEATEVRHCDRIWCSTF